MKEILAFIRVNKVRDTRKELEINGFKNYTCRKCLGRGKNTRSVAATNLVLAMNGGEESKRLIAKRLFAVVVPDEDVQRAVKIIIRANQTGNAGDGKIFVRSIDEAYSIRTGTEPVIRHTAGQVDFHAVILGAIHMCCDPIAVLDNFRYATFFEVFLSPC